MAKPTTSSGLLDMFRNKNRSGLAMTTVMRKSDGTVAAPNENIRIPYKPQYLQARSAGPLKAPVRPKQVSRKSSATLSRQSSTTLSRQSSHEPHTSVKQTKTQRAKRPSPVISTPQFTDSEDDDDDSQTPRKRARIDRYANIDPDRKLRDVDAFSGDVQNDCSLIHAADIANSDTQEHGRFKYEAFFTTLRDDEDDSPTVKLQYPSGFRKESYQVVKPTDETDFKPLAEIRDNMRMVAEFYVDEQTARKITCIEDGSGMIERLDKFARDGEKRSRPGAQTDFVNVIKEYNDLLLAKRTDGTIAKSLDEMKYVPLKLVEEIVKSQTYSRTVSPHINLLKMYEGFSNNVYGELLPKFLSQIFKETKLTSRKVFVDLGSGVGNCVIQAALETGCEAWGCEVMENCAKLASLQAKEFVTRCKLWGIKSGKVSMVQGDFLRNTKIIEVLKRADVVLINNQAFTPALNDALKTHFLDLKEGCQIVSLKEFRSPSHKIKETNINDTVNVLQVVEKERFSQMVSWTDDPGKWYLSVKDTTELNKFVERMKKH